MLKNEIQKFYNTSTYKLYEFVIQTSITQLNNFYSKINQQIAFSFSRLIHITFYSQPTLHKHQQLTKMKKDQQYDYLIKILVIGDSGVGKTNMLLRFAQNNFMTSHLSTIGIDFKIKTINIGKSKVRLQIWDTAGQQRFKTITQTYYRGAMGIVLTYAVNQRQSFQSVQNWMKQIKLHANDNVVKILVGNKSDLPNRQVSYKEGQKLAKQLGMLFFQTSAKEGSNVQNCFTLLAQKIKENLDKQEQVGVVSYTGSKVTKPQQKQKNKQGCC